MNQEANLLLHVRNLNDRMHMNEDKILNSSTLTPDDIVEIRLKQSEYQNCIVWLNNILKAKFPSKIIMNGNAK